MGVRFKEIAEYIRKASILDAIISFVTSSEYVVKEDILKIAGVSVKEEPQEEEAK